MANERMRDQNQGNEPNQGKQQDKAMGAGATTGGQWRPENVERHPSEAPGQGGGIQGTGQRNPNPTQGQAGQETQGKTDKGTQSGGPQDEFSSKRNPEDDKF